ncbi:MAG: hypothetical protein DMG70_29180 [Acidobacteria bacterium]|nr:MAG: hypothetical protein DMG70_29180 [Acidobacteriota bacterium]
MSRMIDLIRSSAVPAALVQAAARGALSLPPAEMIEILVYLANHNKIFSQQARMTLAGWEEKSALAAAADPATPQEVLEYMVASENLRPTLLPALLENPSVHEEWLLELAANGSCAIVKAMMASRRVNTSPPLQNAVASNPNMTQTAVAAVLSEQTAPTASNSEPEAASFEPAPAEPDQVLTVDARVAEPAGPEQVLDEEVSAFFNQHAAEIAAEQGKPFQAIGGIFGEREAAKVDPPNAEGSASGAATAHVPAHKIAHAPTEETRRGGALQKISKLDVKGRIQLAMKGNKEERSILIRDGTKIVALAVLDSPKITDGEVEAFASQKNVLEAVLRGIPMKRRFAKHYPVIRNLVFNPRTPLDLSLSLIKNLLVTDLKNLSANKEVSETVRKLAHKMFKQKTEAGSTKRD